MFIRKCIFGEIPIAQQVVLASTPNPGLNLSIICPPSLLGVQSKECYLGTIRCDEKTKCILESNFINGE